MSGRRKRWGAAIALLIAANMALAGSFLRPRRVEAFTNCPEGISQCSCFDEMGCLRSGYPTDCGENMCGGS